MCLIQHLVEISSNKTLHEVIGILVYPYILLKYTTILEVNLFAFAYRLFHEDFSSINGVLHDDTHTVVKI